MSASMTVRAMRNFRLKYGIPLHELASAIGVKPQWISQVELGEASASNRNKYRMMQAFQLAIHNRQRVLITMEEEFNSMKRQLLEEELEWMSQ